jgi:hypothetical protein
MENSFLILTFRANFCVSMIDVEDKDCYILRWIFRYGPILNPARIRVAFDGCRPDLAQSIVCPIVMVPFGLT